jgi:hypothetical protein
MEELYINWLAVLLAGLASIVIGSVWYAPAVFGKMWAKLAKVDEKKLKKSGVRPFVVAVLLSLLAAFVIAFFSARTWHWAYVLVVLELADAFYADMTWRGAVAFVALFVPYLSSAFVPLEGLPSFLRGFAEHQPVTLAIETLRELTSGTPVGDQATALVLWLGGLTLAALVLVQWLFHRAGRR